MDKAMMKGYIAKRVAKEFKDGDFVNLGIGLPTMVPAYLPADVHVILQAEVGMSGQGGKPEVVDPNVVDAGGQPSSIAPGGAFIDSATSFVPGMGGAMDLCAGAKNVIVAMEHTQKGAPKILKECTLPLTTRTCVSKIITEMAVIEVTPEGLVMTEINPEFTVEQVQEATEATLIVSPDLKPIEE